MARKYIIKTDELSSVTVTENVRSRSIHVSVDGTGKVNVSVPPLTPLPLIKKVLHDNSDAILKWQTKKSANRTIFSPGSNFRTRFHKLIFNPTATDGQCRANVRSDFSTGNGTITITYPPTVDIQEAQYQQFITKVVNEALKCEARHFLPPRLAALARKFGFHYATLDIRNMKSQWGSCSTLGRICLNQQLMRLPDHLIDYVLLHELCHTKEANHGPNFWALLDKVCGCDSKKLRQQLKNFTTQMN